MKDYFQKNQETIKNQTEYLFIKWLILDFKNKWNMCTNHVAIGIVFLQNLSRLNSILYYIIWFSLTIFTLFLLALNLSRENHKTSEKDIGKGLYTFNLLRLPLIVTIFFLSELIGLLLFSSPCLHIFLHLFNYTDRWTIYNSLFSSW